MAWIESHQELAHHPKTRKLARALCVPVPAAVGHLHCLWWWALSYAEDGHLGRYTDEEIAEAAMWDDGEYENRWDDNIVTAPKPTEFVKGLLEAGWIDDTAHGYVLHDWWEYGGKLLRSSEDASEAGSKGNHKRWHVDRGITDVTCRFCRESHPDSPPDEEGNRDPTRGESQITPDKTRQDKKTQEDKDAGFDELWKAYPDRKGNKGSKKTALEQWRKLSQPQRTRALAGVRNYATYCIGAPQYPVDAFRWLRDKSFEEWQEPRNIPQSPNGQYLNPTDPKAYEGWTK